MWGLLFMNLYVALDALLNLSLGFLSCKVEIIMAPGS